MSHRLSFILAGLLFAGVALADDAHADAEFRLALVCPHESWMPAPVKEYRVVKVGVPNTDPSSKSKYEYHFELEVELKGRAAKKEVFRFEDATDGDGDGDQAYSNYPLKGSEKDLERINVSGAAIHPGFKWARLTHDGSAADERCVRKSK